MQHPQHHLHGPGTLTQMSALDGEHLDPDGHKKLAAAIAGIIRSDCEA